MFLSRLFVVFLLTLELSNLTALMAGHSVMMLRASDTNAVSTSRSSSYIMHPRWDSSHSFKAAIGASVTFVPRPIAEEEIRQIPMLDLLLRYNLISGFSLNSHLGSNYITNLASLGAEWTTSLGAFSIGVGDDYSVWYGMAVMDGFDVHATGFLNAPHLALGMKTDEFALTLRAEMLFLTSRSTRVGDLEIASDKNQRLGVSLGIIVEQPFVHNTHLLLALKLNNLKNAYQSWLAFSTFNDSLLYPELSVGVLL